MKKSFISIFLILICYFGFGQYTIPQNLGSPNTLVQNPNYGGFRGGLIPYTFADTSAANSLATALKTYNGALIWTTSPPALHYRAATLNKWVQILPAGDTSGLQAWLLDGNAVTGMATEPLLGTTDSFKLNIGTNNQKRLVIPANGIVRSTSAALKYLAIDTTAGTPFGNLYYTDGATVTTPTWQQTLTAGSTLTGDNTVVNGANTFTMTNNSLAGDYGFVVSSNSTAAASSGQVLGAFVLSGANSNASQLTTALVVSNTHTGTTPTNYGLNVVTQSGGINEGLHINASGGTSNIAVNATQGSVNIGTNGIEGGQLKLLGSTSGTVTTTVAAAAGTWTMTLPTTGGTNGYFLQTNGSGVTTWAAAGGSSQWTDTTAGIYYPDFVGIGSVMNPAYPLHIIKNSSQVRIGYDGSAYTDLNVLASGTLRISSINDAVQIFRSGGSATLQVFNPSGSDGVQLFGGTNTISSASGTGNIIISPGASEKVKIGSSSAPDSTLTVAGSAHITGYLKVDTDPLIYEILLTETGGVQSAYELKNTTGTTFTLSSSDAGVIKIDADSGTPFTANKTLVYVSMNSDSNTPPFATYSANYLHVDNTRVIINTFSDGIITANIATNMSVKIVIYP